MQASKNANVQRQATPESPSYYRPLLQLHNSPWIEEQHHLDEPPDRLPNTVREPPSHVQQVAIAAAAADDDDLPTKHEGHLLSLTPTSVASPSPRPASRALSPSPPTFHGHTRSPVLAR